MQIRLSVFTRDSRYCYSAS